MAFHFLTGDTDGVVYAGGPDGSLVFYKDEARDGTPRWANAGSGQVIGTGWTDFNNVFTAAKGILYAIAPNGDLLFFRDLGRDGTNNWANNGDAQRIGVGWDVFTHVISGDNGVIYAVLPNGDLLFFKDRARNGTSDWHPASGTKIGEGWDVFSRVLPGGGGRIYAIDNAGNLFWFRELARNGRSRWVNRGVGLQIGSGWEAFVDVISAGDGIFYAITPDGFMLFFRDLARNGTADWAFNGAGVTMGGGWTAVPTKPVTVAGYANPLSAGPGDDVSFSVSALSSYDVVLQRLKQQPNGEPGIDVAVGPRQAGIARPAPVLAWRDGCGWPTSFTFTVPDDARSGIYSARCTDLSGQATHICFVVRPPAGQRAELAVLANTNTWTSYNEWGGRSKYSVPMGTTLSFARPNPGITPIEYNVIDHLLRAELRLHNWLEDEGYSFDVYSDLDFHKGIGNFAAYQALLISTHPEYWTAAMMDHLEDYLAVGGSLLYLGGNGLFEQVEIDEAAGTLTHMQDNTTRSRDASYFRNLQPPRPERAVLGVAYRYDNYMTFAPYRVLEPGHRLLAGTGLAQGDLIGENGINGRGASGWEMDTSIAGTAADGVIVSATGPDDRGAPPLNTVVIARGTNPGFGADMTCHDTPAGGRVFSVGSISFVGSMVGDSNLQQIVRNVLAECGATTG
jgi:hypothetical protein